MNGHYVLVAPTGFVEYFVQYVDPERQHMRHTPSRDRAHQFRTSDDARKHRRGSEELRWITSSRA